MFNQNRNNAWVNVLTELLSNRKHISLLLTDDRMRERIQFFAVYIVMFFISGAMSILNMYTEFHLLFMMTLAFAVVNLFCLSISLLSHTGEQIARVLFTVGMIALFSTFLIVGEPQGFSAIWITILPTSGMILYRMKNGIVISMIQFAILVFLLWTKSGQALLMYDYTEAFLMRFPMLYLACLAIGVFFEYVRASTNKALVSMQKKYEQLSTHDVLTGLYNRLGFNRFVDERVHKMRGTMAFAIIDLDNFKSVNDTYGHSCGDAVLQKVGELIGQMTDDNDMACRWGGEEFAILFKDGNEALQKAEKLRIAMSEQVFSADGRTFSITLSCGFVLFTQISATYISNVFSITDMNLYKAKNTGKNKIVSSTID